MEDIVVAEGNKSMTTASQHSVTQLEYTPEPQELEECGPCLELESVSSSAGCNYIQPDQTCSQGSAVSALQSKVKALSQRKNAWKQPSRKGHEKKVVPGSYILGRTLTWGSSSSDEDIKTPAIHEVQAQSMEMLPNDDDFNAAMLALPRGLGEGASLENIAQDLSDAKQDISLSNNKPWAPPKGFWKLTRPETLFLNGETPLGSSNRLLKVNPNVEEEPQKTHILESALHTCGHSRSAPEELSRCGLWRAESLESVCSSSSSVSLAERVEMNRSILRQMLQKAQNKISEASPEPRMEDPHRGVLKDSDWDSGISLHECEKTQQSQRAFVWGDVIPLSPRHEQAKRLLERARMKARSNPLKADHTILPVHRENPDLISWAGISLQRAPLLVKDGGVAAGSGNVSDSSSSDSAGGPRRRHGQSPTRVRFEDESEKEAESRYLERLRQRRRAGERAQGLLGSKPNLASYVNGRGADTSRGGEDTPLWKYKNRKSQENNINGHYKPLVQGAVGQQCNSCGTILSGQNGGQKADGAVSNCLPLPLAPVNGESEGRTVPCWVAPTLPNRLVRIEQIKETYIGAVSSVIVDSDGTHCKDTISMDIGSSRGSLSKQKRKSRRRENPESVANGHGSSGSPPMSRHTTNGTEIHLSNGGTAMPPNPYAPNLLGQKVPVSLSKSQINFTTPMPPPLPPKAEAPSTLVHQPVPPLLQPRKSALKSASKDRPNGQQVVKLTPSPQYCLRHLDSEEVDNLEGSPEVSPDLGHPSKGSTLTHPTSSSTEVCPGWDAYHLAGLEQDQITGQITTNRAENGRGHLNDGQIQEIVRPEPPEQDSPSPSHSSVVSEAELKDTRPKLSLRRLFSAVGLTSSGHLGKGRSSSMEHLSMPQKHSPSPYTSPSPPTRKKNNQLKKAPSLQSLRLGSPFVQLKKSSSVQNLQSPRRKGDRSSAYTPGQQPCSPALSRGLQRTLSVEDVGSPSAVRSVGRVAQAFPDGTLLLELSRPPEGLFGFLVSRGKGRPDSGVYVEEMGDSSTQKLYAGLLGVGDEILEVNGEKVSGLSLELVTRLMIQNSTASLRVLRHRQPHR
ncbi:uncharacterized protein KIAA1614 isoform X4 [Hoplias malabaricus]|uniref:uncharacterized protein KIAA1614 isoform X4 n=1 Tax=Hoplias malabaricus TaxID=27720 RepID=UPI00346304A8